MSAVSQTSVAGVWQPLVESTVLQSVVCDGVPGLLGYPDPDRCLVVSDGPWWSSTVTVVLRLAMQGASSRGLRSPSECFVQSPARALARLGASRGVSSLVTTSARGVQFAGSRPTMFRPQRFARSRRLAPPRALRIYFTALPCPGFKLQGLFPLTEPYHLVGDHHPRAVGAARLPVARRQRTSRRPQGRAPVQSPRCPAG